MADDTEWKDAAKLEQIQTSEVLNKRDVCEIEVLRTRIAVCLFGIPESVKDKADEWENLSYKQYKTNRQNMAKKIAQCILDHQKKSNKLKIYVNFVVILGRRKSGNNKNFTDWVFNVPGKGGQYKTFIDRNCRIYENWNDFLTNNTLPKATICYPVNGRYPDEGFNPKVDFADTPSCSVAKDVLFGFDVATSFTTLVGCGIGTAALFVPIAAPIVWTAFAVTAASGAYGAGRSIENLVDRGKHGETLNPLNSQARSAWLGATVPFLGLAAGTASAIAATARVTNLGVQISQAGRVAINVTNGVNCVAHGVCFVNDVYNIIEVSVNGDQISAIQIIQCIASLLLFANAVVSTYQARLILQSLSSKETAGGIENIYAKLSKTHQTQNGICVRPTNILATANISCFISLVIPWSGMYLKIPPGVCKCVENIFHFLLKNRKSELTAIATGLIPLLKALWEKVQQQAKKHAYEYQWPPTSTDSYYTSNTSMKKTVKKEDTDKITILNMNWDGEKQKIKEIIQEMLQKEKISELEVLKYSQLIFQRLKEDLNEKEKQFQTMCESNKNLSEKQLENIIGIKGERAQHFANEIMKSYRDIKIITLKHDCQRLIEEGGVQIPLYSSYDGPMKILYYHSIQKDGTRIEKYNKILEKANIKTLSSIYFCTENSYFVDLKDTNSEYTMVGVMNFAEDNDMMGIIILLKIT